MGLIDKARELRWRGAGHYTRRFGEEWTAPFEGAVGIEIGGPSAVFGSDGLLPVYRALRRLDGVQVPEGHETWHGRLVEGPYETGEDGLTGQLWLREGADLAYLPEAGYGAILSSHVLEHLANPVAALGEWLRILRPGGHFLIVLPHKEGCADHRRPTTPLSHMQDDERGGVKEDDMTHAEEVIELHDLKREPLLSHAEDLRARVLDNRATRAMHHHVFTTGSALTLLDHLGLRLLRAEVRWPHDIYILAQLPAEDEPPPDNSAMLSEGAPFMRRSPFRADRG